MLKALLTMLLTFYVVVGVDFFSSDLARMTQRKFAKKQLTLGAEIRKM